MWFSSTFLFYDERCEVPVSEKIHLVFVLSFHQTEGLYWLCHQRQAADEIHAREQAVLPVQDVEIRGVASIRVRHHDFNRPQHSRADDEGQWFLLLTRQSANPSQIPLSQKKSSVLAQWYVFGSQYDAAHCWNIKKGCRCWFHKSVPFNHLVLNLETQLQQQHWSGLEIKN